MGFKDRLQDAASKAKEGAVKAKQAVDERRDVKDDEDAPLLELKGTMLGTSEWRPNRVLIFNDRVEEHDPGFLKKSIQVLRYEQIAHIAIKRGALHAELTIESTGGGGIISKGLKKQEAEEARRLIDKRLATIHQREASTSAPLPDDPMERLRKLGELRETEVLTEEEFQAKKRQILDSM
jgi:hypothetical protein